MTGQLSEDGKYMWDGHGWVELPHAHPTPPPVTIDSEQLNQVAMQAGVDPVQLGQTVPYFDQNQDGIIQKQEMEKAAFAVANPPSPSITPPIPSRMDDSGFEQQEDGKPWQIKVLSILIIIMASLGGTIGQQVSKIDEKATKLESDAARNMSSARALETLENQVVFRDEALLVEAKSLLLESEEISRDINDQRIRSEDSWQQLLGTDLFYALDSLYLFGEIPEGTLISALCDNPDESACTKYFVNEITMVSNEIEPCTGTMTPNEDEIKWGCSTRLVFNKQALMEKNFSINDETFSAVAIWDLLEFNLGASGAGYFISDSTTSIDEIPFEWREKPTLWECNYQDSICVDVQSKPVLNGLTTDYCPDFPETIIGCPYSFTFYESYDLKSSSMSDYIYSLQTEIYVIELYLSNPDLYITSDGYEVEDYGMLLAVLNQVYLEEKNNFDTLNNEINTYKVRHQEFIDKWYFSALETQSLVSSYGADKNQSVALIENTTAWTYGVVSNSSGDFASEEAKKEYLRYSYNESILTYQIADNQTQDANEMRAKAGAVYSSVLYVSIATALCGIVTGRIDSKKYTMTMPMVVAALASFVYGCYVFANGII